MPRLYGKSETIHKTVRLTQEQIDLIESQGQDTFTANLNYLLNELLKGESERVRRMQSQQKYLRESAKELDRLLDYIQACRVYVSGLDIAMTASVHLEDLLKKEGAELTQPRPGRRP